MRRAAAAVLVAGIGAVLGSCDKSQQGCLALPCALPLAIQLNVSAEGGGPVQGVTVVVSGGIMATVPCSTGAVESTCYVAGVAGTYELELLASGFQPARRTITVEGETPECGCPTVVPAHLDVTLIRAPE